MKSKEKKDDLTEEELQMEKVCNAFLCNKLKSPYYELMDYLGGVDMYGHHTYFNEVSKRVGVKLDEVIKTLKSILPEPLKTNLESAYKEYVNKTDYDSVFHKNKELMDKILREQAKNIK